MELNLFGNPFQSVRFFSATNKYAQQFFFDRMFIFVSLKNSTKNNAYFMLCSSFLCQAKTVVSGGAGEMSVLVRYLRLGEKTVEMAGTASLSPY